MVACPTCGGELEYIEQYDRYYCQKCKKYAPKGFGKLAEPPTTAPIPCPSCGKKLTFIPEYGRYYCHDCSKYAPRGIEKQATGEVEARPCPTCGKPLTFIEEYKRYYCFDCKKYAPRGEAKPPEAVAAAVSPALVAEKIAVGESVEPATPSIEPEVATVKVKEVAKAEEPAPEMKKEEEVVIEKVAEIQEERPKEEEPPEKEPVEEAGVPTTTEPEKPPLEKRAIETGKKSYLVNLCQAYGLDSTGNRSALKERLIEYMQRQGVPPEEEREAEELPEEIGPAIAEKPTEIAPEAKPTEVTVEEKAPAAPPVVPEAPKEEPVSEKPPEVPPVVEMPMEEPKPTVVPPITVRITRPEATPEAQAEKPAEPEKPAEAPTPQVPPAPATLPIPAPTPEPAPTPAPAPAAPEVAPSKEAAVVVTEKPPTAPPAERPKEAALPPSPRAVAKVVNPCMNCGRELSFVKQYNRYYCYNCREYAPEKETVKVVKPAVAAPAPAPSTPAVPAQARPAAPESKPAAAARPLMRVCPTCGGQLTFVKQYDQWYCFSCKKYVAPTGRNPCPTCGAELKWIASYKRYYCSSCKKYAPAGMAGPSAGEEAATGPAVAKAVAGTPTHTHGGATIGIVLAVTGFIILMIYEMMFLLPPVFDMAPVIFDNVLKVALIMQFLAFLFIALGVIAGLFSLRKKENKL